MNYKILLCLFVIAFFYGLGYFQKSASSGSLSVPTTAMTADQITEKQDQPLPRYSPIALPGLVKKNQKPSKEFDFQNTSGAALFSYLFGGEFQRSGELTSKSFAQLKSRFSQPYSTELMGHRGLAEKEAANRIGLLRAWSQRSAAIKDANLRKEVRNFYEKVAADKTENIFVRRQALRGLAWIANGLSESESWQMHATQDVQVRSLASMSDAQVIEALFEK